MGNEIQSGFSSESKSVKGVINKAFFLAFFEQNEEPNNQNNLGFKKKKRKKEKLVLHF